MQIQIRTSYIQKASLYFECRLLQHNHEDKPHQLGA